ncbi:MAG: hypothetical protein M3N43_07025 [Actinomycetota bacterium]|nr:hypothetical protein [Actinomycetota bacterium]
MTEPTTPTPPRRAWRPTFLQVRLGVLMMALVTGVTGIVQGERRLLHAGIAFGVIGVVMRLVKNLQERGALRQRKEGTGDE